MPDLDEENLEQIRIEIFTNQTKSDWIWEYNYG